MARQSEPGPPQGPAGAPITGLYGTFEWEPGAAEVRWSEGMFAIHGVDPGAFRPTAQAIAQLIHPDDRTLLRASYTQAVGGQGSFACEYRIIRPDGQVRWVQAIGHGFPDPAGRPRMVGTLLDVTDRHEARVALRDTNDTFRLLVEGTRDYAIYMLDPAGHVVSWNLGAQRIKGYEAEEVIGRHFSLFFPPEDAAAGKPQKELEIAQWTGRYEEEGLRVRKDGTRFWASVVITALHDDEGELRGFGKVTRDITDRRAAEAQLRELERLSQFWALRNKLPVTVADMVGAGAAGQEAAVTRLEGAVDRLSQVVRSLELRGAASEGAWAKEDAPDAAAAREHPQVTPDGGQGQGASDLATIVHQAVDEMQAAAVASGIRLDAWLSAAPHVAGVPDRVGGALRHLLTAALQATAAGGRVNVEAGSHDGDEADRAFVRIVGTAPALKRTSQAAAAPPDDQVSAAAIEAARAVVIAEGGRLLVQRTAAGGLDMTVLLPLVRGPSRPGVLPAT